MHMTKNSVLNSGDDVSTEELIQQITYILRRNQNKVFLQTALTKIRNLEKVMCRDKV